MNRHYLQSIMSDNLSTVEMAYIEAKLESAARQGRNVCRIDNDDADNLNNIAAYLGGICGLDMTYGIDFIVVSWK